MKRKAKEKTLAFFIRKLSFCSSLSRVKNTSNRQGEELLLSKNCLAGVASFKKMSSFLSLQI